MKRNKIAVAYEGDWATLFISPEELQKELEDFNLWQTGKADDGRYDDGLDSFEAYTFAQFERLQSLYGLI